MSIQEIVRRDYIRAVEMGEQMAPRLPAGSPERERWERVAQEYRLILTELDAEHAPAERNNPALA